MDSNLLSDFFKKLQGSPSKQVSLSLLTFLYCFSFSKLELQPLNNIVIINNTIIFFIFLVLILILYKTKNNEYNYSYLNNYYVKN